MKRLVFVLVAAGLLAPAALAKGPSEASISGPGLSKAIAFKHMEDASDLTQYAGFFPAAFGQSPDPMLSGRPTAKLGAKYTVRYVVPGPYGKTYHLTQQLYPYAKGGAVTYMKPGQLIFDMTARGGWYRGGDSLKRVLVAAGLPRTAPRQQSGTNLALVLGIGAPGAALIAGGALLFARRRARS